MTISTTNELESLIDEADFSDEDVFVFPVSFAQQRLWFLDQFEPNSPFYNIPMAVRLRGKFEGSIFQRVLNEIVRRHEILRTTFGKLDGEPVQLIAPSGHAPLTIVNLQDLPKTEREQEAFRLANEEAKRPFNLTTGPLFRAHLYQLALDDFVAVFVMHHIISDGWSMGVLVREISILYGAFAANQPSPLPELPIQYADFSDWQRNWLKDEVLQAQLDYWKQKLGDSQTILELPADRTRPAVQTSRGATRACTLSPVLTKAIKNLSQQQETTLFMTLLAVFYALLYRYTNQTSINVGSPIANRNRSEIEGLIGFFVNTLVLRADLHDDLRFTDLLAQVKESMVAAYAHQDLPFEMLVEALQPDRDMSHNPLFQVMFILQNAPSGGQELPNLSLEMVDVETGTATFDITLSMAEMPEGGMDTTMEFNTDLFDHTTIERMLTHFQVLLAHIVAKPEQPIAQIPFLTKNEEHQLLIEWNETAVSYPTNPCIHQLFEAQVEKTPEKTAVFWQDEQLTYAKLNQRANQLAHHLRRFGIGPETIVAVCVERSLDMLVSVMGILKAGGAYLPLDPTYPHERMTHMLADAQPAIILTQQAVAINHPAIAYKRHHVIHLDAGWPAIALEATDNPVNQTQPDNLAYMIYTSGSTGKPKGVMVEHRNLANAYFAWADAYELHTVHAHLQMANFAFDVFSGDMVRSLLSGGKLVLCPREWLLAPDKIFRLMQQEQIDIAEFVPVVLRQLMQYIEENGLTLPAMRLLACGSDNWYVSEYKRFLDFCGPETRLINSFGLTETTIDSTYFESNVPDLSTDQVVPIGRPFSNNKLYILDRQQQPVPIGIPGELYIGGAGVTRGYHNQPELTEAKFLPNPWESPLSSTPKFYRSGDLCRYLPNGNIEFLGRIDHQVKIRGFRIELGEIEAVLGEHEAVQQNAVIVLKAPTGDSRLVAYVVMDDSTQPATGTLRRVLQERLPDYMVPSAFVVLDEMPISANGKVDRRALPAPDWSARDMEDVYVAPRTPVEESLAEIWQQVLSKDQVGIHDNFFDLGGHSLLATQLISRVQDTFDIDLPLRHIFESPTIADLAQHVEIAQRGERKLQAPPIQPVSREEDLPLSFAQQRLWFLDQLEPNSPFYNIPESVRLTGALDVAVLERCLNEVVQRHEALRTTITMTEDGRPFQKITPQLTIPLPQIDLQTLPAAEREAEAMRLVEADTQRPFNLNTGPLLRATLIRLAPDDHIILFTLHHIISDNWSSNILTQEIAILYEAFSNGRFSPLPELPIQYADFAHWQRQWLQGDVLEAQLDFWHHTFADSPTLLSLPTDRPRPPVQTFNGDYLPFTLSEKLSEAVQKLCRETGCTPFMLLLAAYQTLLHRYSGQDQINVGTPIANRNRADIENMIGFFVNTLVVHGDLTGNPTFRQLLQRTRETSLGAFAHQDVPFEMIVDALNVERNLSHSPLFQVMFVIQSGQMQQQRAELPQLTLEPIEVHSGTAKFDLTLFMLEESGQLGGAWEYNTDLFDRATIERMMQHFETLLTSIVDNPDQSIETLPLLTPAERQQLLVDWNQTTAVIPHTQCVHQLFEAQVARTPHATAVRFGAQSLSYADLNQRANQLAHHLRSLGIGPEKLVAIAAERSPEMVVGLLGILKAGAAYVPIDPTYPPDRLAYMLADSAAPILLTQQHLLTEGSLAQTERDSAQTTICLDADWETISHNSPENPENLTQPDNLAYVIYTSGSTGRPKGTMLLHRGLVNYLSWCLQAYPVAAGGGAPVHSSISFDLTITGLFAPLLAGRAIHLLPEDIGVDLLSNALQEMGDYSLVKITPAHLELLTQQISPMEMAGRTHGFVIGGENLLADSLVPWQQNAPETVLINEYGPTETVVGCCVYQVPPGEKRDGSVPIGRPIINTQLYILDKQLQPVPIGVPGELYIGGVQVARGYLNRPELTAERFIQLPVYPELEKTSKNGNMVGQAVYKTGDLCRYLPDGNIEFLGRLDHQVKIHGFRIELGEIEAVLSQLPTLQKVAVIDREDEPGQKRLVAYLVAEGKEQPSAPDLRQLLQEQLPEYMIPSAFVYLEEMPLTSNGKVDRHALPAPEYSREDLAARYAAPETENELILAGIWAQLLHMDEVGIYDSFFELGGDSILSIQVVARANQAGLRLTPRQVFQHPTIAELAAVAGTGPVILAEQGVVTGEVPLTPIQRWFLAQDQPQPHHWNQSVLLQIKRPLSPNTLKAVVADLLQHHDALRLQCQHTEAGWLQNNASLPADVPFNHVDLSACADDELESAIEAACASAQASLNLSSGSLFHLTYLDLGKLRPGRLLFVVHHLAMDGVSWPILLEDFQIAYQQLAQGQPTQFPPKTTSFKQWAERLTAYAQSEALQAELPWWKSIVTTDSPPLPRDFEGSTKANTEGSAHNVVVALTLAETKALLHEVPAAYRTEINDVLLTALAQALAEWTGKETQLVNLEGHGREDLFEDVDLSRTVGWFTALYPVRLDLGGSAQSGQALMQVKEQLRQIPSRGIGYGLLRYLGGITAVSTHPDPEISFNYLGQMDQGGEDANPLISPAIESSGPNRSPQAQRTHLLEVDGGIMGGQLELNWTYSEQIHRQETIEQVANTYITCLRELISHCLSPDAGGVTLSDVADFGWEEDDLDDIFSAIEDSFD